MAEKAPKELGAFSDLLDSARATPLNAISSSSSKYHGDGCIDVLIKTRPLVNSVYSLNAAFLRGRIIPFIKECADILHVLQLCMSFRLSANVIVVVCLVFFFFCAKYRTKPSWAGSKTVRRWQNLHTPCRLTLEGVQCNSTTPHVGG